MSRREQVLMLLQQVLQLPQGCMGLQDNSRLIGALPEFDSMAVVTLITALEEQFCFVIDDDEIDSRVFASVGSLLAFVDQKV
jgi:acyl carrier protein